MSFRDSAVDWSKFPKLRAIFEERPRENVYWDELARLVDGAIIADRASRGTGEREAGRRAGLLAAIAAVLRVKAGPVAECVGAIEAELANPVPAEPPTGHLEDE